MTQFLNPADFDRPPAVQAQRREWRVERIGWLIMGLVLVAGLLGLLGRGPLSKRTLTAGGLTLEYERIVRSNAPAHLTLLIASAGGDPTFRVWLRQEYMLAVQLQHIVPQPLRSYSDSGRLVMEFAAREPTSRYEITVEIEPNHIGNHHAVIGTAADSIRFQQVVLP